jgi:hypothetical protein
LAQVPSIDTGVSTPARGRSARPPAGCANAFWCGRGSFERFGQLLVRGFEFGHAAVQIGCGYVVAGVSRSWVGWLIAVPHARGNVTNVLSVADQARLRSGYPLSNGASADEHRRPAQLAAAGSFCRKRE